MSRATLSACEMSRTVGRYGAGSWLALCVFLCVAAGCNSGLFDATLAVTDESSLPLPGVKVTWSGGEAMTGAGGRAELKGLAHPVMTILSLDGYLDEPVPVGRGDADAIVQAVLLSDGNGSRIVLHCAGDVMLGRRYEDPDEEDSAYQPGDGLVVPADGGTSARALVSDVASPFAAAHIRTVNLETVVGRLDDSAEYPGKRWILRTDPDALAALDSLAVDAAVLANNHQRDFLDDGVAATIAAAEDWGLPTVGGGATQEDAEEPLVIERNGQRVGIIAYTSVDGDYVNGSYPDDTDTEPDDLSASEAWQWEFRLWGWASTGAIIPTLYRRIGSAWEEIEAVEPYLDDDQKAGLWDSVTAVYPELQDWVARRGHGGAAGWNTEAATQAIADLRVDVDLLVVNLHSGYQYADSPSPALRQAAYDAIDAGADIIIGHHPHVLQGTEFYQGKLIIWSLGNFVFDQDFLVTFSSAFLRTVWEDGTLVQARLVPLVLEAYRPVAAVDDSAKRVLRTLWETGLVGGTARRGSDLVVRNELPGAGEDFDHTGFRFEHHTAVILDELPAEQDLTVALGPAQIQALGVDGLVWSQVADTAPEDVLLGRSLFGYGGFEDVDTDGTDADATHWVIDSQYKEIVTSQAYRGTRSLKVSRSPSSNSDVIVHPVARIPIPEHRLWRDADTSADGSAAYSVHLAARRTGQRGLARIRADYYYFDDADPTAAPESALIRSVEYPIDVPDGRTWTELWIDLSAEDLVPAEDGRHIGMVMLNIVMSPATWISATMWFDEVDLVEWRSADELPASWGAWDWILYEGSSAATFSVRTLPW